IPRLVADTGDRVGSAVRVRALDAPSVEIAVAEHDLALRFHLLQLIRTGDVPSFAVLHGDDEDFAPVGIEQLRHGALHPDRLRPADELQALVPNERAG